MVSRKIILEPGDSLEHLWMTKHGDSREYNCGYHSLPRAQTLSDGQMSRAQARKLLTGVLAEGEGNLACRW